MWLEYRERAERIVLNADIRKFASNVSEKQLLEKYESAEKMAKEARKSELENTGRNPKISIGLYYEAANLFGDVVQTIDPSKVSSLNKLKYKYASKEIVISFLIGCLSSAFVTYLTTS